MNSIQKTYNPVMRHSNLLKTQPTIILHKLTIGDKSTINLVKIYFLNITILNTYTFICAGIILCIIIAIFICYLSDTFGEILIG